MSCEYYGNVSQASTHWNPQGGKGTPGATTSHSGAATAATNPHTDPPMVGGFGSASLPPYYAGGYTQGVMYMLLGGPQNQPTPSMGWGKPSLITPPLWLTCSKPSWWHNEAMDVEDPMLPQWSWARQGHARNLRRDEPHRPPQPIHQGGSTRPTQSKGKGNPWATEEELVEQEWEEHVEQLDELLCWLDRADVNPSLADVEGIWIHSRFGNQVVLLHQME